MGTYRYKHNWDFFEKDSEELYYFLGFVAADGYISNNEIEIGLSETDLAILEKFRDLIVPDKPIYYKARTRSYTLKISCRSKIKKFKEFFDMTSNKKHDEIGFPEIPKKYLKDFIRGYVDGDGTMGTTKGYKGEKVYIGPRLRILGNPGFLKDLNEATKTAYSHNTNAISKKGKENVYIVTYNFSTARGILNWLYTDSNIHLERKYATFLELSNM
jgi:hypothetical protein